GLDDRVGPDGTGLFDPDLEEALSLLGAQCPVLTDQPADPDSVVVERADAMLDEAARRVLVDAFPTGTAERRVEGVDHSSERARCPVTCLRGLCHGHASFPAWVPGSGGRRSFGAG